MRIAVMVCLAAAAALAQSPHAGFKVRGALPWHNFLSGPTAWNESDWERYLDRMKELHLNMLALHCYTGGAQRYVNYVEPLIKVAYRDVLPEAGLDTSLTARWGYRPLAVSEFAFGTDKLFRLPDGAKAYGADVAVLARTNEERYNSAQALIRKVIAMAHARGIQVGIGFEFGVYPPELYSIAPDDSYFRSNMLPDPTHPASMEILHNTLDDILSAYPGIDWIWLWLQEHETPEGGHISRGMQTLLDRDSALFRESTRPSTTFTGVWSLAYIRAAYDYLQRKKANVHLAIGGWGGGNQLPGILGGLDRGVPTDIVFTCLNPNQGLAPQPDIMAAIARNRDVWAIPWLEGDAKLWHPQPRVSLMREHVALARQQGLSGVLAIHWRTEETRANLDAFARFSADPESAPSVEDFYRQDCREQFGEAAGLGLAPLLTAMDREKWFEALKSPEYYPYDPEWGRLTPALRARLTEAAQTVERAGADASGRQLENVSWLAATLRFTLLLDDVSRDLEPAYTLKDDWHLGRVNGQELPQRIASSRSALRAAPIEALFKTYAVRVRSRGSLGVLSSLNQRVRLEYRELDRFLSSLERSK